jgi:hypothetical protein
MHLQVVARDLTQGQQALWFAVPKKLLPRAVDRNAFRRVARAAWQALPSREPGRTPQAGLLKVRSVDPQWRELSVITKKKIWRVEIDALLDRFVMPRSGA